jgi:hypothetical protein
MEEQSIQFPAQQYYDDGNDTVIFPVIVETMRIRCRISIEALLDRFTAILHPRAYPNQ